MKAGEMLLLSILFLIVTGTPHHPSPCSNPVYGLSETGDSIWESKLACSQVHRYAELLAARRDSRYAGLPDGALAQDLNLLLLTDHVCDYVLL